MLVEEALVGVLEFSSNRKCVHVYDATDLPSLHVGPRADASDQRLSTVFMIAS